MFFKRKPKTPHTLKAFLDAAADAYVGALSTGNIRGFTPYASAAVCDRLITKIHSGRIFYAGTKERRTRSFAVLKEEEAELTIRFDLTHQDFDYGEVQVGLGDDIHQIWTVQVSPYKITQIKGVGVCD